MTPALSILCAALVAGSWLYLSLRDRKRIALLERHRDAANAAYLRDRVLLTEAHALLHDTAARGKDGRWLPWSERRAAWVKKCEVRG